MSETKKYPKLVEKKETITVKKAQNFLASQVEEQRPVRHGVVEKYALMMKRNQWLASGQTMVFDWNGHMRDGRHRCEAIVLSGVPIEDQIIIYGVDPSVYKVLDSGTPRRMSDGLHIQKEINCTHLQAALTMLDRYLNSNGATNFSVKRFQFSYPDGYELLNKNPGLRDSINFAQITKPVITPSISGWIHYLCAKENQEKADDFFTKLSYGANLDYHSPVRVLRDKLIRGRIPPKLSRDFIIAYTIKAWKKFVQGKPMTKLTWRTAAKPNEPMPRI